MKPIIYLHGYGSGPQSIKGQFFRRKFEQQGVEVRLPDLVEGDFEGLTIGRQMAVAERVANHGEPCIVMGSSLGGYLAALYAKRHPEVERVILLAPALHFPSRVQNLQHPSLLADAPNWEAEPDFQQPGLILHGRRDDVVPAELSIEFAASHPNVKLVLLESDHALTDVLERLWEETWNFLNVS